MDHKPASEKLGQIFYKAAVPLCMINKKTSMLNFNKQFEKTFGYSQEEVPALEDWWLLACPDPEYQKWVIDTCNSEIERAIETNSDIKPIEYNVTCKNGDVRTMVVFGSFIGDDLLLTFFDITERKQAEQERLANIHFLDSMDRISRAIQKTNDFNQMMSDVLDEAISIFNCDRAFLINFSGPDLESWTMPIARWRQGYPISYINKPLPLDSLGQKVVRSMIDSKEPVKAGPGTSFPLTQYVSESFGFKSFMGTTLYPKSGDLWELGIHQCSHERIFTTEEEKLFKEIAIRLTDILTSFLIYRSLVESEQKYRTMMESFADPLYINSSDLQIEYLNPAMKKRIGRDATGEPCYHALHGLSSRCEWCIFDQVVKGVTIETNIKSPLDDKYYLVTNMPIHSQDGTVSKMAIYRDITDYFEAISEKEKAQAKLIQAQKMESIGNLAGGIAHDFNNILSSILGFTELALDSVDKETPIKEDLQEVYAAGLRAKNLVNQILTFARQSDEEVKPVQVYHTIKEVLKFIRSTIPTTIDIKQHIDSECFIMGNATQLHQIMMNLCTNAAHAMEKDGGTLEVTLKNITLDRDSGLGILKYGNYVEITVSDTGIGIDPRILERIFEPYFTTKKTGEGTGMGLALVHGIVDTFGGKIFAESELGKGTVFTIYFPVCKRGSQTNLIDVSEDLPMGQERILFIDDEVSITKIGSRILGDLGYSVTTITNSIEALELFQKNPNDFDLVISDVTMPDMAGDDLAIKILQIRADIPVILSTGYSKKLSEREALEIGVKALTAKPIVKADLAKTVRNVLDEVNG